MRVCAHVCTCVCVQIGCYTYVKCQYTYNCLFSHVIHELITIAQVSFTVDGRSWAIAEVPNPAEPLRSPYPLPPAIVTQHVQQQRRFVLLTAQVYIRNSLTSLTRHYPQYCK